MSHDPWLRQLAGQKPAPPSAPLAAPAAPGTLQKQLEDGLAQLEACLESGALETGGAAFEGGTEVSSRPTRDCLCFWRAPEAPD